MEARASVSAPQPPDKAAEPAHRPAYLLGNPAELRPLHLLLEPLTRRYWWAGYKTPTSKR